MYNSVFGSLHDILSACWRRRYMIVIPMLIFPIVGYFIGSFTPRKWQTYTTILVQESAKLNPFLEDWSVKTNLKERITSLRSLLHSRHMLLSVGYDLNMINSKLSTAENERWVSSMSRALQVELVGKDLVKLTYTTNSVDKIDVILTVVSKRFLDNLLAPELTSLKASEEFLLQQINSRREELAEAEAELADFKRENASHLPSLYGAHENQLTRLNNDLSAKRVNLASAIESKKYMRLRLMQIDPVIGRLEEDIISTRGELGMLRSRYTDNHSKVESALRDLERLEKEHKQRAHKAANLNPDDYGQLWGLANHMKGVDEDSALSVLLVGQLQSLQKADQEVMELNIEISSLEKQVKKFKDSIEKYGAMEMKLTELSRDLNVKRTLYNDLLERFEKAKVTGALGIFEQPERIKIIDKPYKPNMPTNLPIFLFVIGGLIGGMGVGGALALLTELMDTTIRNRDNLEQILQAPVLTRIPYIPH